MLWHALLVVVLAHLAGRVFGWAPVVDRLFPRVRRSGPGAFLGPAMRSWLAFGLPALGALVLLGRGQAVRDLPPEFEVAAAWIGRIDAEPVLVGLLSGVAVGAVVAWHRRRRGKRIWAIGRSPRLPGTARELPAAGVLAASAAVTEELYFRLLLPLLLAPVIGATAAFVAAAVLFGAVHRYQGAAGIVATGIVGLALSALYLGTGALWMAVLAHGVLDLNALVLRPAIAGAWRSFPDRRGMT